MSVDQQIISTACEACFFSTFHFYNNIISGHYNPSLPPAISYLLHSSNVMLLNNQPTNQPNMRIPRMWACPPHSIFIRLSLGLMTMIMMTPITIPPPSFFIGVSSPVVLPRVGAPLPPTRHMQPHWKLATCSRWRNPMLPTSRRQYYLRQHHCCCHTSPLTSFSQIGNATRCIFTNAATWLLLPDKITDILPPEVLSSTSPGVEV